MSSEGSSSGNSLNCSLGNFGSKAMSSPGKSASGGGWLPGPNGSAPAEQVGVYKPAVVPSIAGPSRWRHCTSPPEKSFLRHSFRKVPLDIEGKLLLLQGLCATVRHLDMHLQLSRSMGHDLQPQQVHAPTV